MKNRMPKNTWRTIYLKIQKAARKLRDSGDVAGAYRVAAEGRAINAMAHGSTEESTRHEALTYAKKWAPRMAKQLAA